MHYCMRVAADVLVHRRPLFSDAAVERFIFVSRIAVTEEVPRRIDKRIHRVSLTTRRTTTLRTGCVYKLRHARQRRLARARERRGLR